MLADRKTAEAGAAPSVAARVTAKAAGVYNNSAWDLVDASKEKDFDLKNVKAEELPKELRSMSIEERKAHLEKMNKERETMRRATEVHRRRDEEEEPVGRRLLRRGDIQEQANKQSLARALLPPPRRHSNGAFEDPARRPPALGLQRSVGAPLLAPRSRFPPLRSGGWSRRQRGAMSASRRWTTIFDGHRSIAGHRVRPSPE